MMSRTEQEECYLLLGVDGVTKARAIRAGAGSLHRDWRKRLAMKEIGGV